MNLPSDILKGQPVILLLVCSRPNRLFRFRERGRIGGTWHIVCRLEEGRFQTAVKSWKTGFRIRVELASPFGATFSRETARKYRPYGENTF